MEDKHIIAVEIGSSKIKGAVGAVDPSGTVSLLSVDELQLVNCVRHGQLSNIVSTANAIKTIIQRIENRNAPKKVEGVYVALGGRSVMSYRKEVERRLLPDTEITQDIIDQLTQETLSAGIHGRDILEVLPNEIFIDKKKLENPIGVYGSHIKLVSTVIACKPVLKKNLSILFNEKLDMRIQGFIVRQLAEADVVLTTEERRLGCMLVDFGAETVTVSIYKHNKLQYLMTIPMGSRNITRDITLLNYLEEDAEMIKQQRGSAGKNNPDSLEDVEFTEVNNYIRHRAAEIIANIRQQLAPDESINYPGFTPGELPAGIIIIGRGAKLTDFNTKLEETLKMNVRAGNIMTSDIRIADNRIHPADAIDVISILYEAARRGAEDCFSFVQSTPPPKPEPQKPEEPITPSEPAKPKGDGWSKFWKKTSDGIKDFFKEPREDDNDDDNLFLDDDE